MPGTFRELREKLKRMQIGDRVYVIMDRLQTGAGIPGMICALQDSTVEVVAEFTHGPKILTVRNREDILPSSLYTHSILNLVYQTYEEIEHKYGSILNLATEEIVAQLTQRGLAPQTARRCVDLFDEAEWHNPQLPLRQWLESIRDFYHRSRPGTETLSLAVYASLRCAGGALSAMVQPNAPAEIYQLHRPHPD